MMDRLTAKDIVAGVEIFDLKIGVAEEKAFNLLGQYENTGLTPDEVAEMVQAKSDGRFVELPCKVGNKVWLLIRGYIELWEVDAIKQGKVGVWEIRLRSRMLSQRRPNEFEVCTRKFSSIGKTVFFTKAEAQAQLIKRRGQCADKRKEI